MADDASTEAKADTTKSTTKTPDEPAPLLNEQSVAALEKGYHGETAADHGKHDRPQDVGEFGAFVDHR
jgi:hypothetical protein